PRPVSSRQPGHNTSLLTRHSGAPHSAHCRSGSIVAHECINTPLVGLSLESMAASWDLVRCGGGKREPSHNRKRYKRRGQLPDENACERRRGPHRLRVSSRCESKLPSGSIGTKLPAVTNSRRSGRSKEPTHLRRSCPHHFQGVISPFGTRS